MELVQSDRSISVANHRVRCISCGEVSAVLAADFRCAHCGNLLEVEFPSWLTGSAPEPSSLKALWRERRTSNQSLDSSGVWRFREMLPALDDWASVITLREGQYSGL